MREFSDKDKISLVSNGVYRILDANINRAKEGLRVCEEIVRFVLDSSSLTQEFKKLRHQIRQLAGSFSCSSSSLLEIRESLKDVGRAVYINELKRKDIKDIFFANIQRVKESVRVLEEFSKLLEKNLAVKFKKIRYDIYEVEKKAAKRIFALFDN